MEIIFTIPSELEYFEGLVKLTIIKRDEVLQLDQVATIALTIFSLKRIKRNKNCNKIIHILVEMNNHIIERLVDIGALMSIIATSVVKQLGIMLLVTRLESHKKASRVVTQTMGGIIDFPIHVGKIICKIDFMDNDACCLD
jgi:hypothetical protein